MNQHAFHISQEKMKEFMNKVIAFGEKSGYSPEEFSILLTHSAKFLCETFNVEIKAMIPMERDATPPQGELH